MHHGQLSGRSAAAPYCDDVRKGRHLRKGGSATVRLPVRGGETVRKSCVAAANRCANIEPCRSLSDAKQAMAARAFPDGRGRAEGRFRPRPGRCAIGSGIAWCAGFEGQDISEANGGHIVVHPSSSLDLSAGVMHLARAVDCRSVIIYGGREHPSQSGYSANENLYWSGACAPCWLRNDCNYGRICMQRNSARAGDHCRSAPGGAPRNPA